MIFLFGISLCFSVIIIIIIESRYNLGKKIFQPQCFSFVGGKSILILTDWHGGICGSCVFRETKKKLICFGIEFFTTFSFTVFFSDSIAYILLLLLWSLWIYNYSMHILIQHGHIIIHRTRELFPWLFRHSFNGKKKNSPLIFIIITNYRSLTPW